MANWDNPKITTQYDVFLAECKERDVDSVTLFLNSPTNQVVGSIKLVRGPIKLQEWDGAAWQDKLISIEGGGTGGNNAGTARANLGLGTISTQNSNNVAITGGSITSINTLNVIGTITVGADNAYDLGTFSAQFRKGYFKSAFVLPVGVDKYATS